VPRWHICNYVKLNKDGCWSKTVVVSSILIYRLCRTCFGSIVPCLDRPADENPETGQIQAKDPSGEGRRPRVEKDESPETETLSRLLIVLKTHNKYVIFFIYNFFGPNYFEGPCLFLSFCSDTL